MILPKGIHTVLFALFDADGDLDRESMRQQVEICVELGAAGIITLGLATEVRHLTPVQRRRIVEWNGADIAGRLPFGVTIFEPTAEEQIASVAHAAEYGADWVILQPVPTARDEAELLRGFEQVLLRSAVPCAIQNAPQYIGVGLGIQAISRLCESHPNLFAIKQEVSATETAALVARLAGRLQVFSGRGGIELTDCMEAGIHGHVPAPDYADFLVRIWALHSQGQCGEARELYSRVLPLATFVLQSLESLTTYGKLLFCQRHGLPFHSRPSSAKAETFGLQALRRHSEILGIELDRSLGVPA
jgi:4-hydroxy-tetrahydrodipicolinate synthase